MQRKNDVVLEDEISDVGGLRWAAKRERAYFQFEYPSLVHSSPTNCLKRCEIVIALGPCVTLIGGKFFTRCLSQHGVIWVIPSGLRTRENSEF